MLTGIAFGVLCVVARTRFSVPALYPLAGWGGLAVALYVYGTLLTLWARHYPVVYVPLDRLREAVSRPPGRAEWWLDGRVLTVMTLYLVGFLFQLGVEPDWDPASYLVNGKMMARGQPLYAESWCNKFPGVATVCWAAAEITQGWGQYYLTTVLAWATSLFAIGVLGHAAQGRWGGAAGFHVVALGTAPYLMAPDKVLAEPYLVPFLALSAVGLVRFVESEGRSLRAVALAGLAYGVALVFKQPGAIYGPVVVVGLLLHGFARTGWLRGLKAAIAFSLGCWSVLGLVALTLALCGVFQPFVEHTILYWLYHAPQGGFAPAGPLETLGRIFASTVGARTSWALAACGLVFAARVRSPLLVVSAVWLGFGLVDVYAQITQNASGKYLLTIALPCAVLGARAFGATVSRATDSFDGRQFGGLFVGAVVTAWLGAFCASVYRDTVEPSTWKDAVVTPAAKAGLWVAERSEPGDSLFVVGVHPTAYLSADRYPARRFWGILEVPEWADRFGYRQAIESGLREQPPKFLVLGKVWDRDLFEEALPWFPAFVAERYRYERRYGPVEIYTLTSVAEPRRE